MSQTQVTDFFSRRKRTFKDETILSKEKTLKQHASVETQVTTRSRLRNNKISDETTTTTATEVVNQPKKSDDVVVTKQTTTVIVVEQTTQLTDTTNQQQQQQTSKKKLTAAELKQRMQSFSQKLQKHKEKYGEKEAEKEKEQQAEVQIEAVNKIQDEINKICSKNDTETVPAYEKYHDLATADYEKKFILPVKYQNLFELFKGSDTVVKFMHNRQEICTFLKLRTGVQNITKKNFSQLNLGQFKTVYPTAYIFEQEKLYIDFKNDYHLTIKPNFDKIVTPNENGVRLMSPLLLLERLQKFKNQLFDIVKEAHQKFLKSIGVSVSAKEIKKWHPKFNLEEVDDITASDLPLKPNEIKVKSGEDLKNIAKEVYSTRVKTAIEVVLQQQQQQLEVVKDKPSSQPAKAITEKQKANYSAILERVRAKERHKDLETMVMNSDKEKRLQLLEKYTECVRFIKSFFQAEKKATIDLETVCKKMHESLKSHTANECEDIVRELCNDFKNWISVIKVRQQQYVKIDKNVELTELLPKIDSMIETTKA